MAIALNEKRIEIELFHESSERTTLYHLQIDSRDSSGVLTDCVLRFEREEKGWQERFDFGDARRVIPVNREIIFRHARLHQVVKVVNITVRVCYEIPNNAQEQPREDEVQREHENRPSCNETGERHENSAPDCSRPRAVSMTEFLNEVIKRLAFVWTRLVAHARAALRASLACHERCWVDIYAIEYQLRL